METNFISKKKPIFPVPSSLRKFLKHYGRGIKLPVHYSDLLRFNNAIPLLDRNGNDTLWESVLFAQSEMEHLNRALTEIYALLKTAGDTHATGHLYVDRIDYCTFGNSKPFRIRIVNHYNDNYDYFYVKLADSSRIYGLELEHILSPNRISYFVDGETLIEEHIAGIPGDQFIKSWLNDPQLNTIRLAKEFVKFNERCFVRLLGDMRSYNYVIDITPDFEDVHYRIRAIDFDQQSFEGRRTLYLPQYFKENLPLVKLCMDHMTTETVAQYQLEERVLMSKRIKAARYMVRDLIECMSDDIISVPEKVDQLKKELSLHYDHKSFLKCRNMGDIVKCSLKHMIRRSIAQFKF
ncbi:MAG TPA: hypothetical protein PKH65_08210 [Bacteroidia bacterium]|nr:hypothetical protein [Bacteroidia bacterium]